MSKMSEKPTILLIVVSCLCLVMSGKSPQPLDYSLGKPRIWSYQRVYPFLDGVFQDIAGTTVSPLTLSANGANASTLNAIQNAFQLGVSYSPLTGAQNALAEQQNSVVAANADLQSQILTQQAQLTQQLVNATQLAGQANVALAQVQAQSSPDPTKLANAKEAVAAANINVQTLTAQLAVLKTEMPSTVMGQQTLSAPSQAQFASTALPTQLTQLTAPQGGPSTPSFPVSKQMDNQVNLLWERLSRLVGTLSKADSLTNYNLVLAGFNINLHPVHRKKEIFAVQYKVSGAGKASTDDACDASDARAIDLFPSASAVNIVNNQYKENRFSLAGLLGFGAVSATATFNRDHLQISQSLGQSAYITGFGAGAPEFGWAFGRNLGDDSISPGTRTVFAILAVPKACPQVNIVPEKAAWFAEKSEMWFSSDAANHSVSADYSTNSLNECVQGALDSKKTGCALPRQSVTNITYTPVEYDPTVATNNPATIQLELSQPIDPQLTVSIDGRIVPRARDSFARAIPGTGTQGLLETNSYGTNTWIPISSTALSIQLSPQQVERRFPEIMLSSPLGSTSVTKFLPLAKRSVDSKPPDPKSTDSKPADPKLAETMVSGATFKCVAPCLANMPPLSRRKAAAQSMVAFHWEHPIDHARNIMSDKSKGANTDPDAKETDLFISLTSDNQFSSQNSGASTANATMQIISAAGVSPWGGNTFVTVQTRGPNPGDPPALWRLYCDPLDSRLDCKINPSLGFILHEPVTIEVHDPDHAGGPIAAWKSWSGNGMGEDPVIWRYLQPKWTSSQDKKPPDTLNFCIGVFNLNPDETVSLEGSSLQTSIGSVTKLDPPRDHGCLGRAGPFDLGAAQFLITFTPEQYASISDSMYLVFSDHPAQPAAILNLRAIASPLVTNVTPDFLTYTGQNFIFDKLRVGNSGDTISLACDVTGTSCVANVTDPKKSLGTKAGPLYFLDAKNREVSVSKLVAGVPQNIPYSPPQSNGADGATPGAGKGGGNQGSFQFSISGSASGSSSPPPPATPPANTPGTPAPPPGTSPGAPSPAPTTAAPPVASPTKPQMLVIQ